jgi:hypothetical protein
VDLKNPDFAPLIPATILLMVLLGGPAPALATNREKNKNFPEGDPREVRGVRTYIPMGH